MQWCQISMDDNEVVNVVLGSDVVRIARSSWECQMSPEDVAAAMYSLTNLLSKEYGQRLKVAMRNVFSQVRDDEEEIQFREQMQVQVRRWICE